MNGRAVFVRSVVGSWLAVWGLALILFPGALQGVEGPFGDAMPVSELQVAEPNEVFAEPGILPGGIPVALGLPIASAGASPSAMFQPSGAENFDDGVAVSAAPELVPGEIVPAADLPNVAPAFFIGWSGAIVVATVTGSIIHNAPVTETDTVYVDVGWANFGDGEAPANSFTTKVYLDGVQVYSTLTPFALGGGANQTDINLGTLTPGAHVIRLVVDEENALAESNENDNEISRTVNVAATGTAPDLAPAAFSGWSDSLVISTVAGTNTDAPSVSTADTLYIDMGVGNFGTATVDSTTFVYRLRMNGSIIKLVNTNFELGPNSGSVFQDLTLPPLPEGNYTFRLDVDEENRVAESDEGNNFRERTIVIGSPSTEDFGDAPSSTQSGFAGSYPTLEANDGARHTVVSGFSLGTTSDVEEDGLPSLGALLDDQTTSPDDEDGVSLSTAYFVGETGTITVTVDNTAAVSNPYLDVWVDFNQDGDWADVGETVYSGAVTTGANAIPVAVPGDAVVGLTYARARLHDGTTGLAVTGLSASGEVEDFGIVLANRGAWLDQGAAPVQNGQLETGTEPNRQVNGAVHTVLAHPSDAGTLYIGAVNGGIWKTTNATASDPTWVPQTDFLGSLSMGAMAFDVTDGTSNTLVAGTARYSSFGGIGGDRGAVYRTTNGGTTWVDTGSGGIANENISGIAVRGSTIVLTSSADGGGIFRSTDTGATFSVIQDEDFVDNDNFTDLVEDLSDSNKLRLYAAGEELGVYRSDDFGANWIKITSAGINSEMNALLVDPSSNNTEMAVHPTTGRLYVAILIAGQPRAIFYTDNGTVASPTWVRMDVPILPFDLAGGNGITGASNTSPIEITSAGHGLSTGHYVVVGNVVGNTAANGFFQITVTGSNTFELNGSVGNGAYTSGGTWTRVTGPNPRAKLIDESGAQGRIHFSIQVDPSNHELIYLGGDRQDQPSVIGDSTFGGAIFRGDASIAADPSVVPSPQWDHLTHDQVAFDPNGGTLNGTAPHADSREIVFDAAGNLIEVDDGGVFKRTNPQNNTGDWFSLVGNLGVAEYHDVAYDSLSNIIMAGSQDNGTQYQQVPGSRFWTLSSGGDGGDVGVDTATLSGSGQSIRYSSFQNLGTFRRNVVDHNNVTVTQTLPALTLTGGGSAMIARFKTPVEVNANDPNRLLFMGSNSIYESSDQGSTIVEIGAGLGAGNVLEDAIAYGTTANADALYLGSSDRIYVRTTNGGSLTQSAAYPGTSTGDPVRDVVMNPGDFNHAFAIDSNQVFETTDAGVNWAEVTGDIMSKAGAGLRSIVFIPGSTGAVAIGSNLGVFYARLVDIGTSTIWREVGGNLPNAVVFDLQYDATDDLLLAGTMGRGAWIFHSASESLASTDIRGQFVFYNNSAWDLNTPLGSAEDDNAVATDIVPLLPGGTAGYANYSTYRRGLNGIMIDILGLPGTPTVNDFEFKTGNDATPSAWSTAPAPLELSIRENAGVNTSTRISLIWNDNNLDGTTDANEAIASSWLEVTVKATANTGLVSPAVFYFGSAPGEAGESPGVSANVTISDVFRVFNNLEVNVDVENDYDHDRSKAVVLADVFFAFSHQVAGSSALQLIDLSGGAPSLFSVVPEERMLSEEGLVRMLSTRFVEDDLGFWSEESIPSDRVARLAPREASAIRLTIRRNQHQTVQHATELESGDWVDLPLDWIVGQTDESVDVEIPYALYDEHRFFRLVSDVTAEE